MLMQRITCEKIKLLNFIAKSSSALNLFSSSYFYAFLPRIVSFPSCSLHTTSQINSELKFCVVGSGPAGFYTTEKLLKQFKDAKVDVLDRLPTPFGLVRSGVAPDHPETKLVINQFTRVASDKRFRFFGNVHVGRHLSLQDLIHNYHAVILAYGAENDRALGIPGEHLSGVISAREFVWWYNGHPDFATWQVDLSSSDTAVILGQGNVALDCARILLRDKEELKKTDISENAFSSLKQSTINKVLIVGRRGPVQAACTAKEVRELLGLKNVHVDVNKEDLRISHIDEEEMKKNRSKKRVYELFCKAAEAREAVDKNEIENKNKNEKEKEKEILETNKEIKFIFFRSPSSFLPASEKEGRVGCIELEKTILEDGGEGRAQRAVNTGQKEILPCGLVLRSIGYKSEPIPNLPFDENRGIVPNLHGRVLDSESSNGSSVDVSDNERSFCFSNGLYVVGWLKRGPTGIIGTNLVDAEETVACIVEDWKNGILKNGVSSNTSFRDLKQLLMEKNTEYVSFDEWKKIDEEEVRRGRLAGKSREKIVNVIEMLNIAKE